jgi:hypothetical protein
MTAPPLPFGIFTRDASDRLCYEVDALESSTYLVVSHMIVQQFNLTTPDHLVVGFDQLIQECAWMTTLLA